VEEHAQRQSDPCPRHARPRRQPASARDRPPPPRPWRQPLPRDAVAVHRALVRRTLLLTSSPNRAITSPSLSGAAWWQSRSAQETCTHDAWLAISPSVGIGPGRDFARLGFASSRLGLRRRTGRCATQERSRLTVPDSWLCPPIDGPGCMRQPASTR